MAIEDLRRIKPGVAVEPQYSEDTQENVEPSQRERALRNVTEEAFEKDTRGAEHQISQFSERFHDRMISINLPDPEERKGLWFTDSAEFIEVLTLLNLDSNAHRQIVRDYLELEDLATGSSNRLLVESKQRELLVDLLCYKSRSDMGAEKSLRERSMWVTTRTQSDQNIKMPSDEAPSGGFLSIFRRKK
jgi:hypothetical protein